MNSSETSLIVTKLKELGGLASDLVSGGNYVTGFECIDLGEVKNLDDAVVSINKLYPKSQLEKGDVASADSWSVVWNRINECIWYGIEDNDGDEPNRPPRTPEQIEQLSQVRDSIKRLFDQLIDKKATIYEFYRSSRTNSAIELDDYVVMWAYRFIVLNPDGTAYLLHGSSSD